MHHTVESNKMLSALVLFLFLIEETGSLFQFHVAFRFFLSTV